MFRMRQTTISRGGQISIPAEVRRRWGTSRLSVEDTGEALILRPIPADPIRAAIGSLAGPGPTSGIARGLTRIEEASVGEHRRRAK